MTGIHRSRSEDETRKVAGAFSELLRPGDLVALFGGLGSGKTQFVKGICEALDVRSPVTSPTFVRLHRYEGRTRDAVNVLLYHFDLYRTASAEEVLDLGFQEFASGSGICLVEWAEKVQEFLPADRYDVLFTFGPNENEREIAIEKVKTGEEHLSLKGRKV